MSDAYATVDIPKSLPIHGMALTSTGRKIEHNKVVVGAQTYESTSRPSRQAVFTGTVEDECVDLFLLK